MSAAPRIAVIGSGYVGTVVAACFSAIGRTVVGVEIDPEKLAQLRAGSAPFFENNLDTLLSEQVTSGRLTFTDDVSAAMADSEVVFLCVGTPTGANGHPDMSAVAAAARAIGAGLHQKHVLVTKSTVPIGSGHWLETIIEDSLPPDHPVESFSVVSNPEFLREGSAIEDFLHPDRIVLGSDDPEAIALVTEAYRPIIDQSFEGGDPANCPALIATGLATAETIKYAANAFLASKISFINEVAQICEKVGADVTEVANAIGMDHRIGRPFLNAGVGWGGSCFGKDLDALAAMARDYGFEPRMLQAVKEVNRQQRMVIVEKLQVHLRPMRGRRVALLGLAFKPGTDDLRDAPAVDIAARLMELGVSVTAYDPVVKDVPGVDGITTAPDAYAAGDRADAVVLLTEWPEFDGLDFVKLAGLMRGRVFLDGRNQFDPSTVRAAGLIYDGIGRGDAGYESPVARPARR